MTDYEALARRFHAALVRIAAYVPPQRLHRTAEKEYGLNGAEAIEYAYDNVREEAKAALKGVRMPRSAHPPRQSTSRAGE